MGQDVFVNIVLHFPLLFFSLLRLQNELTFKLSGVNNSTAPPLGMLKIPLFKKSTHGKCILISFRLISGTLKEKTTKNKITKFCELSPGHSILEMPDLSFLTSEPCLVFSVSG